MNMLRGRKAPARVALIGPIAFYVGLLIALITALWPAEIVPLSGLYVGLALLGVIIGALNITVKETTPFLLASVAFIVTVHSMYGLIGDVAGVPIPKAIGLLATNITVLIGAAALLIALRAIYDLARSK
jgi:hypothetical protein